MARIRASCPDCGEIELRVPDIHVSICRDTGEGDYSFICPACNERVTKEAERRTLDLLVASGVSVAFWSTPIERLVEEVDEPLSEDDIIDLHEELADDIRVAEAIKELCEGK